VTVICKATKSERQGTQGWRHEIEPEQFSLFSEGNPDEEQFLSENLLP
jgi:hypothetical protein